MSKNFELTKLDWNDPSVYSMIGPYAMNRAIIQKLGNPITTDTGVCWYLIYKDNTLKAFCAVEKTKVSMCIKNFYAIDEDKSWFFELAKIISEEFKKSDVNKLYCYVPTDMLNQAIKHGFKQTKPGKDWHRLIKEK